MHATNPGNRRRAFRVAVVATVAAAATAISVAIPAAADVARAPSEPKPTIVLVHGAFADASGWNDVTERLQKQGYTVLAASNPLRGLHTDAAYVRSILESIEGPIVLVGHSYGGAVITNAATGMANVEALVYVAAYALDEGERLVDANALGGGHTDLADHIVVRPYPGAPEGDADGYIDPAYFRELFAADLPKKQTAVMAASQRPAALQALFTPSGVPAWKAIPSWFVVASQDHTIPPEAERAMAERAGSTTVEIDSSHVVMMSHPGEVTDVILDAAG
ncbi:alpha/beta fold hydrolase [Agromyces aurantiacus]|uniref:Alpha/beta fold hydrolase n=1 Tax=Agromyces aurantiacus TaxID=165814 RepID=A0ABV9R711_9MICO|nr:alpha/beta hydrolase [Agromyces aurantiacus]MBM7503737.1 pimeloyl-ACP methyl ester carboxylesterase [Agromyces aurantiacus]